MENSSLKEPEEIELSESEPPHRERKFLEELNPEGLRA